MVNPLTIGAFQTPNRRRVGALPPGAAPATTLATAAAGMSAGTWLQFTTASSQDSVLGVGTDSGSVTYYCNSMPWNPVDKAIEIVAMDHNWPAGMRHMRYNDATNTFTLESEGAVNGTSVGHGYDHCAVNPYNGDVYHRIYGAFTGVLRVTRKAHGANTWATIPNGSVNDQVAMGTCWWTGSFTGGGGGAQGQWMLYAVGNGNGTATDGNVVAFNPLTNAWSLGADGYSPFYGGPSGTYHNVMEYSAVKNIAVYGGGNAAPTKLWKLNADGTHSALTDAPSGKLIGMNSQGVLIEEPVTGNFLLLSGGELWELNPNGSGTWTQQTGGRAPPAGVGNPTTPTNNGNNGILGTAVADYGVVIFLHQFSSSGGSMWIYKHA